jgi:pantoate kinase
VDHRRLLRNAFSSHGGIEVDTQGDRDVVVAGEVHLDLLGSEVVVGTEIDDLGDDFGRGGEGAHLGALGAVAQTVETQLLVVTELAVVGLPADSVVATGLGDVAADLLGVADDRETVLCLPLKLLLGHKPSPSTSWGSGRIRWCP